MKQLDVDEETFCKMVELAKYEAWLETNSCTLCGRKSSVLTNLTVDDELHWLCEDCLWDQHQQTW